MFEALRNKKISFDDEITTSNKQLVWAEVVTWKLVKVYSLKDMFKSIAIASANDASVAVAEHIAGSINKFVEMMNDKAKKLV